jgi:hypothetical protein
MKKSGRGIKSYLLKAWMKAKINLLARKQVPIEWVLRARQALGKGP